MRTISIRLDDQTDAALRAFCERHGINQTDAVKSAIDQLARSDRPTPAELAARHGLIGAFRSGDGELGAEHSQRLKARLRAAAAAAAMPPAPRSARRSARR